MNQVYRLPRKSILFHPAGITFALLVLVVSAVIFQADGDALALARLGTRFSHGNPAGSEGYDGQFVYYIARDLDPSAVRIYLDVPAYRYQRILMPLLAHILSFGDSTLLPWVLAILGILVHTAGTWMLAEILAAWGVSRWYALVYGLWAGLVLAVRLDLPEPLAYALVIGAVLSHIMKRAWMTWILWGMALFAKEVVVLFVVATILFHLLKRDWVNLIGVTCVGIFPYAIFQAWLWMEFGQPGIASGGAMATSFEIIPFMGLLRIGLYSPYYLLAMLAVFGPTVVLPSLWGVWVAVREWLTGDTELVVIALLGHALIMFFLPFSTYRETGGLLRFSSGLVLSVILFAAHFKLRKVLNYTLFWFVLNVFLIKS